MKRLLIAVCTLGLLGLLGVAGPALSGAPYIPKPEEFELAPDASHRLGSAAASGPVVSRELPTPQRFNVLGFRWRGGEADIAVRTRLGDGAWSDWTPVPAHADHAPDPGRGERISGTSSDPIWAGEADSLQYRSSRRLDGLRLHFVNTRGTATSADRARTGLRRLVNSGVVAASGLARAQPSGQRPPIAPRSSWGGDRYCAPRARPSTGTVRAALVHHTVNTNGYSAADVPAMILGICRYHRDSNGWDDIGYNFVVDRFGKIWEGRAGGTDRAVIGAQAQGFNSQTTGIANLGTHTALPQTSATLSSIARLIRWKLPLHGQPTSGRVTVASAGGPASRYALGQRVSLQRVSGHRDTGKTTCPGDALYAQLPDLRRLVGSVGPVPAAARPVVTAMLAPALATHGDSVALSGRISGADGQPLSEAPVQVQELVGRRWRTRATGTTDGSGAFSVEIVASARSLLRARYPGGASAGSAASRRRVLQVRPRFTLDVAATDGSGGAAISGDITPAKPLVSILVERRTADGFEDIAVLDGRPREGRFSVAYRFPGDGEYRVSAGFAGDAEHAMGESAPVRVIVVGGGAASSARQTGSPGR